MFDTEHAPYVKRGLELRSTPIDLGTLEPPSGSTLRVELEGLDRRPRASVRATVTHEGRPAYTCDGSLDRAAGAWVCHGLGPGRFRVVVRGTGLGPGAPGERGGRLLLDRVVTADGEADLTLRLRLP